MIAKIIKYFAVFLIIVTSQKYMLAADIYSLGPFKDLPDYSWVRSIVIEGEIKEGDSVKFLKLFDEINNSGARAMLVHLSSPGGNVFEAMKIGIFIRDRYLSTVAPVETYGIGKCRFKNKSICTCKSSCFLI